MSLRDRELTSPGPTPAPARAPKPQHPRGWEPGVAWDGTAGTLTTAPLDGPPSSWDELLAVWDLDPQVYEVVEPVQYRAWDGPIGEGNVRRMFYYRATIRTRRTGADAVPELLAMIRRHKRKPAAHVDGHPFAVMAGDLQAGKPDGDGTAGTIERFLAGTDLALDEYRSSLKRGRCGSTVYLPWLGDCIEGNESQGGGNVARNDATLTESVRIYRHLMLHQIKTFAPYAERIVVPVVPGNHDEPHRIAGKMASRYDDSWAIEGASAVAMAVGENPNLGHVSFMFPGRDELVLVLDIGGTITALAHGHQFGRDVDKWWANQAHGMQPAGDATLLLAGHLHHYVHRDTGSKTFIQIPALDGGSTWFRHRYGANAPSGIAWAVIGGGSVHDHGRIAL